MTCVVFGELPLEIQVPVIYPDARIAVLDEYFLRTRVTRDIHDPYRIHVQAVEGIFAELQPGDGLFRSFIQRRRNALLDLSCSSVEDHQPEVPGCDDLIHTVPVYVVYLERKIGGEFLDLAAVAGFAYLPEHLSRFNADCSHAGNHGIAVLVYLALILADDEEPFVGSRQMAEPYLPCSPEIPEVYGFPENRRPVFLRCGLLFPFPLAGLFKILAVLSLGHADFDILVSCRTAGTKGYASAVVTIVIDLN